MEFDDVFHYVGQFGVFQAWLFVLLSLPSYYSGYQNIAMTFLGPNHEHWCSVDCLTNYSYAVQKNVGIPYDPLDQNETYSECKQFDLEYCAYDESEILNWNRSAETENTTIVDCSSWVYDQTEFISTAVSEYDLVCDRDLFVTLTSSIYLSGILVGAPLSGVLSDNFGRKPILIIGTAGHFIFALSAAFANNYWAFALLRFLLSMTNAFSYLCAFVILMEVTGPKYRTVIGVVYQIVFSFGFMMLSGMAFFVRDFQKLQIVMAVQVVVCVCYVWLVPESPRWLLSQNKPDEAVEVLNKMATFNNKSLPENFTISQAKEDDKNKEKSEDDGNKLGMMAILRNSILRRELFICYLGWFTSSLVYYGLSLNTSTLAGSIYLNTFLSGLVEVPANLLAIFTLAYFGRNPTLAWSFVVAGVSSFLCIPLLGNDDLAWLMTTFSMIGKAAITICFTCIYIYTAELFPTPVRHVAVGTSSMVSRVGGLLAPFMGEALISVWEPLPSVIFGVFGLGSGLCTFLLPETLNQKLPDTLQEAADLGKLGRSKSTKALIGSETEATLSALDDPKTLQMDSEATIEGLENSTTNGKINPAYMADSDEVEAPANDGPTSSDSNNRNANIYVDVLPDYASESTTSKL